MNTPEIAEVLRIDAERRSLRPRSNGPLAGCGAHDTRIERGPNISWDYVEQGREYRDQGRFELARQSYALALSTCRNDADLAIIKRELASVELEIRTMR